MSEELFIISMVIVFVSIIFTLVFCYLKLYFSADRALNDLSHISSEASAKDITVVIPARNEEYHIESCLDSILKQELISRIIVIDDHSSDGTANAVRNIAQQDDRIMLVQAPDLPEGWLGKNHALQTGSLYCDSKYILFTDADVHFKGNVIYAVHEYMEEKRLDHVGGMFGLECKTLAEKICCPVLAVIALTALSLSAKRHGSSTGAFNMLRTSVYEDIGRHSKIRNHIVDDISLARLIKKNGYSSAFLDLSSSVTVRLFKGIKGYFQAVKRSSIPFLNNSIGLAVVLGLIGLFICLALAIVLMAGIWFFIFSILENDPEKGFTGLFMILVYFCSAVPFLIYKSCNEAKRFWGSLYIFPLLSMIISVFVSAYMIFFRKPITWCGREYTNVK